MGFHVRHLSESSLRINYEMNGAAGILLTFKADAITTSDAFSSSVSHLFDAYYEHRDRERLINEINEKFNADRISS